MGMRIGVVQASYGKDPSSNIEKTRKIVLSGYREADLIILPEYSMINIIGLDPIEVYSLSEKLDDSTYLSRIEDLSREVGAYILTHFIARTDKHPLTISSSVLVKPGGGWEHIYDKIHLFDAYGYKESMYFIPGNKLSKEIIVRGVRIRVAICFDIRFPELFRIYARKGATLVAIHSGWVKGPLKEETLEFLARARAHENTVWIVIADQCGDKFVGRSMIVDPLGVKRVDMGINEGYIEYNIDESDVRKARELIPVVNVSVRKWSIEFKP